VALPQSSFDFYLKLDGVPGERQSAPKTLMAQGSHLVIGGSDGLTVLGSADGHVVIHVPEGPLASNAAAARR
jgi:hypothetical protein